MNDNIRIHTHTHTQFTRTQLFNSGWSVVQGGLLVWDRVASRLLPSWLTSKHARNNM